LATRKKAAEPDIPVQEISGEVPAPQGKLTQDMTDEEIMAAIQADMASRPAPPEPRKVTIRELFQQGVALVASSTGKQFRNGVPTVSENTALKLYELTLMWALNNRGGAPSHDIIEPDVSEDVPDDPPFEANEIIGNLEGNDEEAA